MVLTLDVGHKFQEIDGFGASGCWSLDPIGKEWSEPNKERLADLLFSQERGIGLSLWRFNIGAGGAATDKLWDPWRGAECFRPSEDVPYDWGRQVGQQWFLRAAKARGVERFLAFANSPPTWLTVNGHAHCDAQTGSTNLKPGAEGRYARFLVDVLAHFRDEGLPFQFVSPLNEPNWDWMGGQEGNRWSIAGIRRVVAALHQALRTARLKTEIAVVDSGDIPSLLDDAAYSEYARARDPRVHYTGGNEPKGWGKYRDYVGELLGDPAVRAQIGNRITGHAYWIDAAHHDHHELRQLLRRSIDRHAPGARYWQTEYCVMEHHRDLGMETALRVARVIHHDLVFAHASAWQWWLAVSPADYKDGLIYTDYRSGSRQQNILPSKTLWVLGHYSRFVRPGASRVSLEPSTGRDGLLASAYVDRRRDRVVVVLVNAGEGTRRVRLEPGPPEWAPYVTSAADDLAAKPAVRGKDVVEVPARSLVTLVGRLSAASPARRGAAPAGPAPEPVPADGVFYEVRCGAPATGETVGRWNSLPDMPCGDDPRTGRRWGYWTFGRTGSRSDGPGPLDSVRWDDGDTPGEGPTYRFEVPKGARLRVEVGFRDPWANACRAMAVTVAGTRREERLVPGSQPVRKVYDEVKVVGDALEVSVARAAGTTDRYQDPLVSWIRVSAARDQRPKTRDQRLGLGGFAVQAIGDGEGVARPSDPPARAQVEPVGVVPPEIGLQVGPQLVGVDACPGEDRHQLGAPVAAQPESQAAIAVELVQTRGERRIRRAKASRREARLNVEQGKTTVDLATGAIHYDLR